MQNRDQVNAYGGLGKVGLDYKHSGEQEEGGNYEVPAFSPALLHLKPQPKEESEELENASDEEMLVDDIDKLEDELKMIDDIVIDEQDDGPAYPIPTTDDGFLKILREKFGHESFKEG